MGRSPCCAKEGLNRGAWTVREDKILRDYITEHGEGGWRNLPKNAGLKRCGKSCRLRWLNYLRPDIKRGNISPDEEELIIRLHKLLGNRWSLIAGRLPGRTDNEIKNYWNTNLRKKVKDQHRSSALSFSTDRKQENMKKAENPLSPTVSNSPLKMESLVIRTKASKCSKVFINPQSQQTCQFLGTNTGAGASSSSMRERNCSFDNKSTESNTHLHGSSSLAENVNPSDLMIDINMGEFSLSDLLDSDFSDFRGFASKSSSRNDNNNESPSLEQPLVFSDEMMQDFWTVSNSASNLNSLASFLGSEGDWLGC